MRCAVRAIVAATVVSFSATIHSAAGRVQLGDLLIPTCLHGSVCKAPIRGALRQLASSLYGHIERIPSSG
jgi:hypothetical protein